MCVLSSSKCQQRGKEKVKKHTSTAKGEGYIQRGDESTEVVVTWRPFSALFRDQKKRVNKKKTHLYVSHMDGGEAQCAVAVADDRGRME
jgi:hypothetical protein